jgi:hypothetical protein
MIDEGIERMEPYRMSRRQPLTVRQRRLAAELLKLRGETPRERVVADTGISEGALLKMEKARTRPQRRTLVTLLEYYGAPAEKREELLELWVHATRSSDLHPIAESLPENYQTFVGFEAEAVTLSDFEGFFVPGLLQTEAYATALIRSQLPELDDAGIETRVQVRMRRQAVLQRSNSTRLWAILDEAVVRRKVGGDDVMRNQLGHLAEVGRAGNTVTLQVIPFDAGAHTGMGGSFQIMDFADPDPSLVYTENFSGGVFLESEDEVERHRINFQRLTAQALSPHETLKLIENAAAAA